jgi:hypothetical protein
MATLREYLNAKLKAKGMTVKQAKKNAGKYKSISAAKKAGSLYYTDKNGKVMAAVFAEDLKKPLTPSKSLRPKARPKKEPPVAKTATQPKVTTTKLKPRKDDPEVKKIVDDAKKAITRREQALRNAINKPGNEAARKAVEKFGPLTAIERAKLRAAEKKKKKKK